MKWLLSEDQMQLSLRKSWSEDEVRGAYDCDILS